MRSDQSGRVWEAQLAQLHARYQSSGRAVIVRNHPEVRVKRDRSGRIVGADFRATGAPDYTLFTLSGFIVADAKRTERARWPLGNLHPHQAVALSAIQTMGGLGLLLVSSPSGSYALPWDCLRPLWERWHTGRAARGQASLTPDQMSAMAISQAPPGLMLDYLQAALDALDR